MTAFADYLTRTEHMLVMCAVWAAIGLTRAIFPALENNPSWRRLLPALPILCCSVAVWFPGLVDGAPTERFLLGIVLGSLCGHAHKFCKRTIFGNDRRIRDHPTRL